MFLNLFSQVIDACHNSSLSVFSFFLCDRQLFIAYSVFGRCFVYILVILCVKRHQGERFYGLFSVIV